MLRRLLHQQQDEDLVGADNAMAAAALRRHFLDLTQSFMLPLERYEIVSLIN
jgi:hypothetical protein